MRPLPHANAYSTRYQQNSMICELLFPPSILAVKLHRKSLIIVLEMEIYIYDISNIRLLHVIEMSPNPEGVSSSPSFPRGPLLIIQLYAFYHHQQTTHILHIPPLFPHPHPR